MPITKAKSRERVYVQLRKIRENDNLSKKEKAMAILAIPQSDVVWTDNPYELSLAQRDARSVLAGNDKNLADYLAGFYQNAKNKCKDLYAEVLNYFTPEEHNYTQNRN